MNENDDGSGDRNGESKRQQQ